MYVCMFVSMDNVCMYVCMYVSNHPSIDPCLCALATVCKVIRKHLHTLSQTGVHGHAHAYTYFSTHTAGDTHVKMVVGELSERLTAIITVAGHVLNSKQNDFHSTEACL